MAELLALLRTALDSESSDYEEIYPLFTQCRRYCDLEKPSWFKVRKVIEIMMYFCARAQVQYFLANFLETAINHATGNLRIRTREIWLILPEATAFGVRLSHASRKKLDSLRTAQ